jgi:uncharacterized protein YneF (UPF0154 family)
MDASGFFCSFFERKMLKQVQDANDPINKNALKVIALLQFEVNESIHPLLLFFYWNHRWQP